MTFHNWAQVLTEIKLTVSNITHQLANTGFAKLGQKLEQKCLCQYELPIWQFCAAIKSIQPISKSIQ